MARHLKQLLSMCLLTIALAGCGGGGGGSAANGAGTNDSSSAGATSGGPADSTTKPAGTITLAWDEPVAGTGSPAGYRLKYGTATGSYTTSVDVGAKTSCTVNDLAPGTYYFTVTAYDATGGESELSNEVVKQMP